MSIFIAWFLRGGWQYLAAIGIVVGAYYWAHHRGVMEERGVWEKKEIAAVKEAAKATAAMQAAVDQAEIANAQRDAAYALAREPNTREVVRYVKSKPAALPCPDPDGVRLGTASIDAANAALAAH